MASHIARVGATAGWISLVGILGYHLVLQAVAGTRVSGTVDPDSIAAYYQADAIAWLGVVQIVVMVPFIVMVSALREILAPSERARLWATVGFAAAITEAALIVTVSAAQAALVAGAAAGSDLVVTFRFWDVLYNTGVYVAEMALTAALGLAFLHTGLFPRWLVALSFVTAAGMAVAASAIWVGIPDAATLPANLAFAVWFGGVSIALGRLASLPSRVALVATA